jgi:hypothetical protein
MSIVFRDGNNATLATFPLIVAVASNPAGAGEVSNDYFNPSLEELHATVVSLTEQLNAAIAELNAARESGELDGPQGPAGPAGPRGPKGDTGAGFKVLGYYSTHADLVASVPAPNVGDAYGVGTSDPYDIYIYGENSGWVNNGPLQGAKGDPGNPGPAGANGVSCTHSWNGTTLSVTSASGTSSADLKGEKGDKGDDYVLTNADKSEIADEVKEGLTPADIGAAPKSYILHGTYHYDYDNGNDEVTLTNFNWDELLAAITSDEDVYVAARLTTDDGGIVECFFKAYAPDDEFVTFQQSLRGGYKVFDVYSDGSIDVFRWDLRPETWYFTLEDGSTVTKAVHVQ